MRKNSARKWLHATLDLLPVIIIPLFAIFMHRHDATTYEVEVSQNQVVDFNQNLKNGDFESLNYWFSVNSTITLSSNYVNVVLTSDYTLRGISQFYSHSNANDLFLFRAVVKNVSSESMTYSIGSEFSFTNVTVTGYDINTISIIRTIPLLDNSRVWIGNGLSANNFDFNLYYFNLFNLTQMFGEGNEPTVNEFNSYYSDDYYPYNTGTRQLLKDVSTVTYNNTDIGSQLVYALYTPINDYMNFNNVFNFGAIYDWLQLNIFNGNAPLSIFIVWNIFLYEFLMDLIFLLYALFMFFIDFCTNLIDRFHCKASGGH